MLSVVRGRLIEVMASETGKTIAEADVEVSEAIDFAHHYADLALELDRVPEASFSPVEVTLVVPPWNFPVSIPAGGVLAALATGSAVLFKPAPQARRSGAVLAEAIWEAGVPRELLVLVDVDEGGLGQQLITAPEIGRVLLTGSFDTAALFRSWRAELPLLAETSGKNAIIVTPSADLDLAVADLVSSAFGNAGQKCSAASLAILVGSVGQLGAVPPPAGGCRHQHEGRLAAGSVHPHGSGDRAGHRQARVRAHPVGRRRELAGQAAAVGFE